LAAASPVPAPANKIEQLEDIQGSNVLEIPVSPSYVIRRQQRFQTKQMPFAKPCIHGLRSDGRVFQAGEARAGKLAAVHQVSGQQAGRIPAGPSVAGKSQMHAFAGITGVEQPDRIERDGLETGGMDQLANAGVRIAHHQSAPFIDTPIVGLGPAFAAHPRPPVEYGDSTIPLAPQMIRRRQPRRPGADDGDALVRLHLKPL
jgi:hypothetical protein